MQHKSRGEKLAIAAVLMTAANFFGKLLGFLRDILISNYYGATAQTDAFFLALSIPTILIGVFTSSADSAIMAQYGKLLQCEDGRSGADRYFSNIINLLTLIASCIAIITLIAPQYILLLFAPTFEGARLAMACMYLRLFSFVGLFHIWYCFFCAYLLCYEKTGVRVVLSFLTNILVALALLFAHDTKMYMLSIAYMLGTALEALLPIIASQRAGYRYQPVLSVRKYHFPEFIRFFLPIMGSALLADLLMYSDRFLSSFLAEGSLSALNYSSKIVSIFSNIMVVGIGAILLPVLTRFQLSNQSEKFRFTASSVCFGVILVLFPIAVLCILYSDDLVAALYLRGAFTEENARVVSAAFRAYGMQILLVSLQSVLVKTFHSTGDTKYPFRVSVTTFIVNVALRVLLMLRYGVVGIALATTISVFLGCFLYFLHFQKLYGWSPVFFGLRQVVSLFVCTMLIFIVRKVIPTFSSPWLQLIVSGGSAFLAYAAGAFVLFRKELVQCRQMLQ